MYMPILRGKRFELLALRELARAPEDLSSIEPIVEPVKLATLDTDLARACEAWLARGWALNVVVNPSVGEMASPLPSEQILKAVASIHRSMNGDVLDESRLRANGALGVVYAVPADERSLVLGVDELGRHLPDDIRITLWLRDYLQPSVVASAVGPIRAAIDAVVTEDIRAGRRLIGEIDGWAPALVSLSDRFPARATNAEYGDGEETIFTEEHLYFEADNLKGFSDFATIGRAYRDGGGAPKFVVIHWTYLKSDGGRRSGPVYLRHFKSAESSAVAPVQHKFSEAASKLVEYIEGEGVQATPAFDSLADGVRLAHYPGLGTLKKLSIKNHLAVVSEALSNARVR